MRAKGRCRVTDGSRQSGRTSNRSTVWPTMAQPTSNCGRMCSGGRRRARNHWSAAWWAVSSCGVKAMGTRSRLWRPRLQRVVHPLHQVLHCNLAEVPVGHELAEDLFVAFHAVDHQALERLLDEVGAEALVQDIDQL